MPDLSSYTDALYDRLLGGWDDADARDAAILLAPTVAQIVADAWDEGFSRGFYDVLAGSDRDASESAAVNPYLGGAA